ncbi:MULTISPECIES: LysR family transcriptional regulator [Anaerostipes]|uniref:LysR family transcriptional regulator n=2 Tax=Anaerostipes TaxID=207244 RepID=A0ABV4DHY2_9FIRM|nr:MULTISPECIES: LysR family transcriptional regulator [Anaerostipes]MBC5677719.1 LysR family transcriptional regulator [Anaerostipes hominis (ex Liu et al. 2021)]MBS4927315.1 LysR family transcriptional regulator [Anaerostipes sp.]WRY46149.1 LysR family transcriptional regulator [Anaerostipes sp. PC18]
MTKYNALKLQTLSQQEHRGGSLTQWFQCQVTDLNITTAYNLIYNASLLVDEGLGYAVGLDKIINTSHSSLCFRSPLAPKLEEEMSILWKKHQIFSRPAEKFLTY